MNLPTYKTKSIKPREIEPKWWVVDATNQTVGRLSTWVANHIRGKHKPYFTPHVNCGDKIIIVNGEKIRFTGKKMNNKAYISYTGYPGGQRTTTPKALLQKKPCHILRHAIKGMLPKNKLANAIFKNLFIYTGHEHPHQAQKPEKVTFKLS